MNLQSTFLTQLEITYFDIPRSNQYNINITNPYFIETCFSLNSCKLFILIWYSGVSLAAIERWFPRRWQSMTIHRVFYKVFQQKQEMAQPPRFRKIRFIDNSSAKFICIYFDDNLTADYPVCFVDVKFRVTNNSIVFIFKIKETKWNYFLFHFSNYIFLHKRYIILTIHLFVHLRLFDRLQFVHTRAQLYDKTNLLRAWSRGFVCFQIIIALEGAA